MIVILLLFIVSILPIVGQFYFSQEKLKGSLHFPLYAIHISAMIAGLALSYGCTWIALGLINAVDERTCVIGATAFFGIGLLGVFIIQPLIALYFYIRVSRVKDII